MTLTTREPTGAVGWPMLLVEGREGARKTSEALRLTADPRIGDAYVIEVGERRADEYATLGTFQIVEHDGHLRTIIPAIRDVMALPPREGRPNLLIIDSGTHLWDLVKRAAEGIARGSKAARAKLADDPDAEIDVGHQAWNRAKDPYWWNWLNDLRAWPGVFVMTARADEVAKFEGGRPVLNQTEYRVDVERGTPFIFDATIRMRGAKPALVTTAKSLLFTVPADGLELPAELPLVHAVFDLFKASTDVTLSIAQAKGALVATARGLGLDDETATACAADAWKRASGQRSTFDHVAMSALIDALQPPTDDEPSDDPAQTAVSDAQRLSAASEGAGATDPAADQQERSEPPVGIDGNLLTIDGDDLAWQMATDDEQFEIEQQVKQMLAREIDARLHVESLPISGDIADRRARLARRLVHVEGTITQSA